MRTNILTSVVFGSAIALALVVSPRPAFADGPSWPNVKDPPGKSFDDRFNSLDRTLESLGDQFNLLKTELEKNGCQGAITSPPKEDNFRGIYCMSPDGKNGQFLVGAPGVISNADPMWSHDGKMVAFGGVQTIGDYRAGRSYIYALEGPFKGMIRDLGYGITPSWSPDDRQIAYMIYDGNPAGAQPGVWIMDSDGTHRRWITNAWFPRWSPKGKHLACYAPDGQGELLLVDVGSGDSRPLLASHDCEAKPNEFANWSPDGKSILFIGTHDGKEHVAALDFSKDDEIRILYTNDEPSVQLQGPPTYSPDGRRVLFMKQDMGQDMGTRAYWRSYIYSMPTDGSSGPALLEGKKLGNINRGPAFSPDGSKLLISSER